MVTIILLIDPGKNRRAHIRDTLKQEGYLVFEAADAKTAHEAARARIPDLIISSLAYPDESDTGLYMALLRDPDVGRISFIYLGDKDDIIAHARRLLFSLDSYLSPSHKESELLGIVKKTLKADAKTISQNHS